MKYISALCILIFSTLPLGPGIPRPGGPGGPGGPGSPIYKNDQLNLVDEILSFN